MLLRPLVWKFSSQLIKQNRICAKWISAYLSNQVGWERFWTKNLIVDLGAELTRPESELISILSRFVDIHLLQPNIPNQTQFSFLLKPYEEIAGFAKENIKTKTAAPPSVQIQTRRMTSPLAEVKYVTAEIRKLLDSGVQANEVAVIAPEVEAYWPLLQFYLSEEGILANKDQTCRLQSIPVVTWWMSRIRLAISKFEYSDLENANYIMKPDVNIRFEKFEALFKRILESEDLARNSLVQKAFQRSFSSDQLLSLTEFLGFIASFWHENTSVEHLENLMREILQNARTNTRQDISLQLGTWIFWLEQILAKMEIKVSSGYRNGVQVLNLSMSDQPALKHRFFLGLSENNLKSKKVMLISPQEIEKIFTDLGFHLSHHEQSQLDFELRWLLMQENVKNDLCFPMTELSGQEATPHRVWMENGGEKHHHVDDPDQTRHDLLQNQDDIVKVQERGFSLQDSQAKLVQIEKDLQLAITLAEEDYFPLQKQIQLSPSSLESFHNCPFQFAASKVFRLLDPAEADLDSSSLTTGNLVHGLFEKLTGFQNNSNTDTVQRRFDYSEEEIGQFLEEIYNKISQGMSERGEYVGDRAFWPSLKKKVTKIGQRFLEYEKSIATPIVKVVEQEKKFSFEYEKIQWRGAIDRIDQIQGQGLVVYDYKPKNKSFEPKKWSEDKKLQLGFYAWAISRGLIQDLQDVEVVGAQYYIYKNFEKKGIDPTDADHAKLLTEFYSLLESDIQVMSAALLKGNFPAKPLDEDKTCEYCRWSQICRAPHLMK